MTGNEKNFFKGGVQLKNEKVENCENVIKSCKQKL